MEPRLYVKSESWPGKTVVAKCSKCHIHTTV